MHVEGYCPACGAHSLMLASGGHVTCGALRCPDPCAADTILSEQETEHIVVFTAEGFTVKHPLRERVNDELLTCELHLHIANLDGPPSVPGTYRAFLAAGRWTFFPIAEAA